MSKSHCVLKLLAKAYPLVPNSITAISDKLNARTKPQYVTLYRLKTSVDNKIQKQKAAKSKSAYGWLYWKQKKKKFISADGKLESCNLQAQTPQINEGNVSAQPQQTGSQHKYQADRLS